MSEMTQREKDALDRWITREPDWVDNEEEMEMQKTERYDFTKDEVIKIFSDKIGKPVSRVRFSSRTQAVICEVGGESE